MTPTEPATDGRPFHATTRNNPTAHNSCCTPSPRNADGGSNTTRPDKPPNFRQPTRQRREGGNDGHQIPRRSPSSGLPRHLRPVHPPAHRRTPYRLPQDRRPRPARRGRPRSLRPGRPGRAGERALVRWKGGRVMAKQQSRRRFGKVRKLPSKRWQASYIGPDVERQYAPNTFRTKTDADRWLARVEADISSGKWLDEGQIGRAHV